jgi:Holliday junction resolvasome RuvABC endonuclease subunit
MILGLDVSTSITGATVLDDQGNILFCADWDTRKYKDIYIKAEVVEQGLKSLLKDFEITQIFIEQSLQSFRSGFSSAKTLSTLSKMNGIVSWMCYSIWSVKPEHVSATAARKMCGIKVPRGQKAKEVVLNFLLDNEDGFEIQYTKYGNPKPGAYDRADSIVIARAGYSLWKERNSKS